MLLKVILHLRNGARLGSLFKAVIEEERNGKELTLRVQEAAIYTNFLGIKRRLQNLDETVESVVVDFENAWVVDHTVLEKLHTMERSWSNRRLFLVGLDGHEASSNHQLASRRRPRPVGAV